MKKILNAIETIFRSEALLSFTVLTIFLGGAVMIEWIR